MVDSLAVLASAAHGERSLVARGLTDQGSMREVIWRAFRESVAPWAELDYAQDVRASRLLDLVRSADGPARPSVVIVSSPALFDRAGALEPYRTPFADRFPAGWADERDRWTPLYVQPIVAIHNTHRAPPPRTWRDLADETLRDRIVLDDPARMLTSGPAFAELVSALGEPAWTDLLAGIAAQRPHLVGDNERAVLEVATGSRWVGLSNWNVARRVRPGSPVRHVFLDPTPCIPGFAVLVAEPPAPALARLFLAWLASDEGQRAYAATGRIPARLDVVATPSLATILPAAVAPVFGTSDWLTEPERWTARFRELLPAGDGALEGKVAARS
jgi:ABC-type Fe3+ transport system substrate-binding protein